MNEAIRQVTHVQNIRYDKAEERLYIIDQTLLPNEEKEIELRTVEEMIEAIKMLRIRGAPAIGICAGYCMYALARDIDAKDNETFYRKLRIDGELLGAARPTAVNLRWAVGEMLDTAKAHLKDDRAELLEALYRKAVDIHEDDIAKCTAISEYGLSLLKDGDGVLTHCNAGPLATSRYGTGQGPFLLAAERGIHIRVFADETRPLLQGARLTSYELQRAGVDVTLICDNMASMVMKNGWVQACFVGCDRIGRQRRLRQQDRHQRRGHPGQALRYPRVYAGAHLYHRHELSRRGAHPHRAAGRRRDQESLVRKAHGPAGGEVLQPVLRCDGP